MLVAVGARLKGHPVYTPSKAEPKTYTMALPPNPDAVCAKCHEKIYESYEKTPMARASGEAQAGMLQGGFFNAASGVQYRVLMQDGRAWLTYDRAASGERPALNGKLQLMAFVGSGERGRTFLYEIDELWFEAPINYYNLTGKWGMAPGYKPAKRMSAPLPVDSNCLHCHTSAVQQALPGARNKYAGMPFRQAGIGCSACHGDPSRHMAKMGAGPIVNPATLDPMRRDSICLQCHLEGDVTIFRAGTSLSRFRPGDDLSQYATHFVEAGAQTGGRRAVSQYEALTHSACKRASGDNLTCTTCHDPHSTPSAAERVSYYRSKCLMCHTGVAMETRHHPEQADCTACHMPARKTTDISHNELTDHDIRARPAAAAPADMQQDDALVPVMGERAGDRSLGLAYAQLAEHGDQGAGEKALGLLRKAEKEGENDAQVETQLGFLEQMSGNLAGARREYAAGLAEDQDDVTAMANLAVLDAASGRADEAVNLLQKVVQDDPSQTAAGLNLAFIECRMSRKREALDVLHRLAELNPDDPELFDFATKGMYGGQRCKLH